MQVLSQNSDKREKIILNSGLDKPFVNTSLFYT